MISRGCSNAGIFRRGRPNTATPAGSTDAVAQADVPTRRFRPDLSTEDRTRRDNAAKTSLRDARQERFTYLGSAFGTHCPYNSSLRMHRSASPSKKSVQAQDASARAAGS